MTDWEYEKYNSNKEKVFTDNFINEKILKSIRRKDLITKIPLAKDNCYSIIRMLDSLNQLITYNDKINHIEIGNFYGNIFNEIEELTKNTENKIKEIREKIINNVEI